VSVRTSSRALLAALCVVAAGGGVSRASAPPLTPEQKAELEIWTEQLADASTSELAGKTRLAAARLLLARTYPQARAVLQDFLKREDGSAAKIAIAEAIARWGGGVRHEFIALLMAMLKGKDAAVRTPAARALVTYKNYGVIESLIGVIADEQEARAVRLDTITALRHVVDKRVVGALVALLDDKDPAIAKAALATLPNVTNIPGKDARQWRQWWEENRGKRLEEWLKEWAETTSRRLRKLERDNAELRLRLMEAYESVYAATPAAGRPAVVMKLLGDVLAEVRLAGLGLAERLAGGGTAELPAELREAVRKLLSDDEAEVRAKAAAAAGAMGDAEAVAVLLKRLEVEKVSAARRAVLAALGQIGDASALPAVLEDVSSAEEAVAIAAAVAVEKLAAERPPAGELRDAAAKALLSRYAAAEKTKRSEDTAALLEALLKAMATVRSDRFVPVAAAALKDAEAVVRLAAVTCLGRLGDGNSAEAVLPLVSDPDRSVRRAVIDVLASLGGAKYLATFLERTQAASEPDAAVRQRARDVVMELLAKGSTKLMQDVIARLENRPDAREWRIEIMGRLVERLEADNAPDLHAARRQLGLALMEAGRPAAAAVQLQQAHDLLLKAKNPLAQAVWGEWLAALYEADLPRVPEVIAAQQNEGAFKKAYDDLLSRMGKLKEAGESESLAALAEAAVKHLAPRLAAEELEALKKRRDQARANRLRADREQVARLAADLLSSDAAARKRASDAIRQMGQRALRPLVEELGKAVEAGNPKAEAAVLAEIAHLAPDLKGYDAKAGKDERVKVIDAWMRSLK
jgi:HEAT repeat protein